MNPRSTVHQPLTPENAAPAAALRAVLPPTKLPLSPDIREPFDQMMLHTPSAAGTTVHPGTVGGVPGWWSHPEAAQPGAAILYVHGGAYVVGSARSSVPLATHLAVRTRAAVFTADYRRAPEHPFPAAVDDALAAYRGLAAQGYTAIALAGDSAGGGLALVTLARANEAARQGTLRAPRGAAVMSPWTDLTLSGQSVTARADADPLLSRETLGHAAALYLAGHDASDPLVSPRFGALTGLPPVSLHVGEDEVLLDDSVRYAERALTAGSGVTLHVWAGMTHVFPASVGTLAAAARALDEIGTFLNAVLSTANSLRSDSEPQVD